MNWIVFIWTFATAACLALAWVFGLVWWQQRRLAAGHLVFAVAAAATACLTFLEMRAQFVESVEVYGRLLQWAHVVVWVLIVSLVGMVRYYLKSGRPWLAWTTIGLRTLAVILNFAFPPNLNFREITELGRITFLGESSVYPIGVINPLMAVGLLSHVFLIVFIGDAAVSLWRRGDRLQAAIAGGGIIIMILASVVHGLLVQTRVVNTPIMTALYYSGIMFIMGIELSRAVAQSGRVARELQESQLKVQLAQSIAGVGLWSWHVDGARIDMSIQGRALHGLRPGEEISLGGFLDSFVAEDRPKMRGDMLTAVQQQRSFRAEGRLLPTAGATRWLELQGKLVPEGEAGGRHMTGISLDVTTRKQSELALRQSLTFTRSVLDSLSSSIAVLDRAGVIIQFNQQWEQCFRANGGDPARCGLGANYLSVCQTAAAVDGGVARQALEGIRSVLEGRSERFELDYPCDAPAGARWFFMRVVPLLSSGGEGGVVVSHSDITAFRQAIREKEQLRRELEHAGRVSLLGELSGSLAHELNQPLAAILANAQAVHRWLEAGQPDWAEIKASIADIVAQDKRAGQIVHRVRALARKEIPERQWLDVNQLVEVSVALMRNECIAVNLRLVVTLSPALPKVRGSEIELQQVLLNLLLNGLQAQEAAPVAARSLAVATQTDGDWVTISVRDTGPGLPAEVKARLGETFFTTKPTGLGLGLAFCRRTMETHGGRLSADNHPEGGAVFTLTLPTRA